jgi:dolichol-phosphate mannosyltransferase
MVRVTVVVPMRNEAGNARPVILGIRDALVGGPGGEIVAVDDASGDATFDVLQELRAEVPELRVIRHGSPGGQSAAVHSGVRAARGEVVCTLDGDGQNPPSELPKLWAPLLADTSGSLGLVAGQRVGRRDTWSKRMASRLANRLRGWMLADGTRDSACGLKGFRRDAFLALPYFDHMHRFLPALFRRDGWSVLLVDVAHAPRLSGRSNYTNLQRGLVGIVDLAGVAWLIRRRKKAVAIDTPAAAAGRLEAAE